MNKSERVTLSINNLKYLGIFRPSSTELYNRLIERVRSGETIKISLSRDEFEKRREQNDMKLSRDDSDPGLIADL